MPTIDGPRQNRRLSKPKPRRVVPHPEVQRSAPPARHPVHPVPAQRRVGVFAKPFSPAREAPTTRLEQARRQAAAKTRRAARKAPVPAPSIPVVRPQNQTPGYREAVRRLATPIVRQVHSEGMKRDRTGGKGYWNAVHEQLDAMGPQARRVFRTYMQTYAKPAGKKIAEARLREIYRASGGDPVRFRQMAMQTIEGRQKRGHGLSDIAAAANPLGLAGRLLSGPIATQVQRSGGTNLAGALRLAREPEEIARTYLEHPGTIGKDFAFARDFILGTAAIPYNLIRDPKGTVRKLPDMAREAPRALLQDEINRHRAAFEGNYGAFRQKVRETGAAPYVFDAATIASGLGKGAGLLARTGALGRRAEEFVSRPRARMRIAPGETRRQRDETRKFAPNLVRLAYQHRRDAHRMGAHERRETRARRQADEFRARGGDEPPGTRRFIQPEDHTLPRSKALENTVERAGGRLHTDKNGRVDKVTFTADRAGRSSPAHHDAVTRRLEQLGFERRRVGGSLVYYAPKEVTRRSRLLEARGVRSIPAHLKGVAVNEIRSATAENAHAWKQATKKLSRPERAALMLAGTGRLPLDNPKGALERLDAIEARIVSEVGDGPRPRWATDTLKRIAYLRQHADKAFTPALRAAYEKVYPLVKAGEREDPFRIPGRQLAATYQPAGIELGVARGRSTVEAFDIRATEKSIARHREKVAGRAPGKRVAGETPLHAMRQWLAGEYAKALKTGDKAAARRFVQMRDSIDRQIEERRAKPGASGRPDADPAQVEWYHGTPARFDGPPTSEGKWSDLGVYLTSDPGYASKVYAGEGGRTMRMRVSPKRVFETRFGRIDADAMEAAVSALLERARAAEKLPRELGRYGIGPLTIPGLEGMLRRLRDPEFRAAISGVEAPGDKRIQTGMGPARVNREGGGEPVDLTLDRPIEVRITDDQGNVTRGRAVRLRRKVLKGRKFGEWRVTVEHEGGRREFFKSDLDSPEMAVEVLTPRPAGLGPESRRALESPRRDTADLLQEWRDFDIALREKSMDIATAEGDALGSVGHKPLREVLQSLGYDAVRKVDVYADALVVLDEKLLGRRSRSDEVKSWLLQGAKQEKGESTADWVKRVKKAMADNGIDHPPFFAPSEELRTPKFSIYAAGGTKSPEPSKRRTGVLQRQGRERTDPTVIFEGIQRNHKTRISAQLVVDVFDRVAHHRYRNLPNHELKKLAQNEGFDPSLYAVWYPKLYRDTLRNRLVGEQEGSAAGAGRSTTQLEADAAGQDAAFTHLKALVDPEHKDSAVIVANNIRDLHAQLDSPRFKAERGTLIPRAAADEILSSTKETAFGRVMERLKTAQSRAVLGGLNFNWVQADAIVNTLVATVFGGASPAAFVQQHRFFKNLPADVKRWAHDELDIGTSRSNVHIPKMGAAMNNRFVNFFRFLRESPWGQRARPVQHTINTFLRAERAIGNNPQRRALAYHLLRKEAFRQLDHDVGAMNGLLHRVSSAFTLGAFTPEAVQKHMLAIVRNKREFEEIGRRTAEILGDWTTFTALERKTVGRYFFFYPYLRYSMKLAFYTLPLDHPVRLAIVANLANLNMDEQRRLIGGTEDDTYLAAGRYFYRDEKGVMHEYNVRTFNPVGNTFTEAQESSDLLQLMPPVFTIMLGQVEKRDIYRGRDWRVKGTANREATRDIGPLDGLLGSERWRIMARELIDLPPITREIAKYMLPGEQGDDSLPFSPRPTVFKDAERQAQADRKRARDTTSLAGRFLQDQFRAFVPKESDIEEVLQRRHAHLPGGTGVGNQPKGSGWGARPQKRTGSSTGWGGSAGGSSSGWGG